MNIKKVDDKPLVIHAKHKTKIHAHEPKSAAIKGSNIYTVDRSPKRKASSQPGTGESARGTARRSEAQSRIRKNTKTYRRSTIHDSFAKENGIRRLRQNIRQANQSVKTKKHSLHIAGSVGTVWTEAASDQLEGGEEIRQAAYLAGEAARPVTGTASRGAALFKRKAIEAKKKKIKKVDAGKKLAKKSAEKAVKDTAKTASKTAAKETAKETAKVGAKIAAKTAATAAGTAVAPGVGTAIGIAAGYAAGAEVDAKDVQITNRNRKISFFLDKMKAEENQRDSIAKLAKDLITKRIMLWVKTAAPVVGLVLLLLVLLVAVVVIPVVAVVGVAYNSPFAIFLPPLESGDTVTTVASACVAEFNREVTTLANEHTGCDTGEIVYVDYEGAETPDNYYDILAVYMVKYGVGDTATIMNDKSKGWLQSVVDDMCSYTTSTGTKEVEGTDADGNPTTTTQSVLYANVTYKTWRDMVSVYNFNSDEQAMLAEFMNPEYLAYLGYSPGGGGGNMQSALSDSEISSILSGITDSTRRSVCDYALHRVGYPYSQTMRDSGTYYDCSSLAYYSWKSAGVDVSFGGATTAAAEAQGLKEAGKTVSYESMQPGDLIFYSTSANGRYMNITHVAVYVGGGKVVEALNEKYGVVYQDVRTANIVLICSPG